MCYNLPLSFQVYKKNPYFWTLDIGAKSSVKESGRLCDLIGQRVGFTMVCCFGHISRGYDRIFIPFCEINMNYNELFDVSQYYTTLIVFSAISSPIPKHHVWPSNLLVSWLQNIKQHGRWFSWLSRSCEDENSSRIIRQQTFVATTPNDEVFGGGLENFIQINKKISSKKIKN